MSAADPAPNPPPIAGLAGDAAVINITRAGRRHASQGRWQQMGDTPGTAPDTPEPDQQQQLAERFEETFNEHRLTLTDDKAAAVYAVTLDLVRQMLLGAHATGIVDETEREQLDAMMQGLTDIPALVATGK